MGRVKEMLRRLTSACISGGVPRGCVPVEVCDGEGERERFLVPVEALQHPSLAALLQLAEEEYGFKQEGILRIPCDISNFRDVLATVVSEPPRRSRK